MSDAPPPYRFDLTALTRLLARVRAGRGRHSAPETLDSWVVWLIAGAVFTIVLATAVVLVVAGGDEDQSRPTAAAPSGTAELEPSESEVTGEPSGSPSATPTPQRATRAGDLFVGLQSTVARLIRDGQVSPGDGEDLSKRLQEAEKALAQGDLDKTWNELRGFSEKIADLRKGDKLSRPGYNALAADLRQLTRALRRS